MKSLFQLALVGMLLALSIPGTAGTVLVVADEFEQMEILKTYMKEHGDYHLELLEQDEFPDTISQEFDGVIEFVHGKLRDDVAKAIIDYTLAGGRTVVLHHGVSSGKKNTKGWYDFLGMELDRAEGAENYYYWMHDVEFYMVNLNPNHFITSHNVKYSHGVSYRPSDAPSTMANFAGIRFIDSEVFVNHQFTDGREKTVLFGFKFKNPKTSETIMQDRSGWYKPKGDGYVFYFHPGHTVEDFKHENYCQIILNAFEWKP
ncbi:hypothetical protein GF373_15810 [bacterium]|nr:hypothetical protein [bacterium]